MSREISAIVIAMMATVIIRFLPFVIFGKKRANHPLVIRLGETLPGATIGLLLVYVFSDISFEQTSSWLPELIAVLSIMIIYKFFKSSLFAIFLGTTIYVLLKEFLFK